MLQTAIAPQREGIDRQSLSDAQLLVLIAHDENWALSEIYERYARLVFSIAVKTLNDQASAEEIVQQVFTQVWRHARQYRLERGKFSNWVSTITRNQCINEFRLRRRQPAIDPEGWESLDWFADKDNLIPDAQDPLEQASIRQALQHIPSQERLVIELTFWGGMTQQEIASHCHFPIGTVKTRLRHGKMRLKLLLQESD